METSLENYSTIGPSQTTKRGKLLLQQAMIAQDTPCGIPEMQKLQDVLAPRYTLKVYPQEVRGPLLFRGKDFKDGKYIHVYHHDEHFDTITSITAFLSYGYYCEKCDYGYNNREQHKHCGSKCKGCLASNPCVEE